MVQVIKSTLLVLTTLFPIVNPLGCAPLFLSLTHYYSTDQRKLLSRRIAINSIAVIVVSYLIGAHILAFFGISLPVVQVGGGLIVVATGWAMLKERDEDSTKTNVQRTVDVQDLFRRAFYPRGTAHFFDYWSGNRSGADRGQCVPVLRVCRPSGPRAGRDRDEHHHAVVVVFARLHRGADHLEWTFGSAEFGICRCAVGRANQTGVHLQFGNSLFPSKASAAQAPK